MHRDLGLWVIGGMGVVGIGVVGGQAGGNDPGWEYYPDMVHPVNPEPLVAYRALPEADTVSRMHAPAGTIPWGRDTFPGGRYTFPFPPGFQGYMDAAGWRENPVAASERVLEQGKELYRIYCAVCHGEKGEGDGSIVESGAFVARPPTYYQQRLYLVSDGQMFHVLTYGKGLMPSYAKQLTVRERWMVIRYIRFMQDQYLQQTQKITLEEYIRQHQNTR